MLKVLKQLYEMACLTEDTIFRTVEVYIAGSFKLAAVVQTHHKLVNVVLWHPYITMASSNDSPYKYYMAIASNEFHVTVVDLSSLFGKWTMSFI